MIRNGLSSQNPQAVMQAHQRAADFYLQHPQAVRGAENGQQIEEAAQRWRMQTDKMGRSPEEAAQYLAEMNSPEARKRHAALLESEPVQKRLKDIDAGRVEGQFAKWWRLGDPSLGATEEGRALAVVEYKELFKASLGEVDGDLDAAEELAFQYFTRSWGTSDYSEQAVVFGRSVVQKFPIENMHPAVAGGYDYIGQQAKEHLRNNGIETDEIFLTGNQYTQHDMYSHSVNETGLGPRLTLWYKHENAWQYEQFAFRVDVFAALSEDYMAGEAELQARLAARDAERDRRANAPSRYEAKHSGTKATPTGDLIRQGAGAVAGAADAAIDAGIGAVGAAVDAIPDNSGRGGDPRSRRSKRNQESN